MINFAGTGFKPKMTELIPEYIMNVSLGGKVFGQLLASGCSGQFRSFLIAACGILAIIVKIKVYQKLVNYALGNLIAGRFQL